MPQPEQGHWHNKLTTRKETPKLIFCTHLIPVVKFEFLVTPQKIYMALLWSLTAEHPVVGPQVYK